MASSKWAVVEAEEVGGGEEDWEMRTFSLMSLSTEAHFIVLRVDCVISLSSQPHHCLEDFQNPSFDLKSKMLCFFFFMWINEKISKVEEQKQMD